MSGIGRNPRRVGRNSLRVVVLDDYPLIYEGVAAMLAPRPDLFTVTSAHARELPRQGADIVLRDITGASVQQLQELVGWLRDHWVRHVVAFMWKFSPAQAQQCLELGFGGVVSKRIRGTELMQALLQVDRGQRVVLEGAPRARIKTTPPPTVERFRLTPREKDMLTCIGHGMTNEEIAQQTGLGINTVKSYTRTAYGKIGTHNRAAATAWAYTHLIGLDEPNNPTVHAPREPQ